MCFLKRAALVVAALGTSTGSVAGSGTENAAVIAVRVIAPRASSYATVRLQALGHALSWTVEREDRTRVVFRHVPPGSYQISVQLGGFHELNDRVDIQAATAYDFVADMAPATQPQTASALRLIDQELSARVFDRGTLQVLPGDDVMWSVVETTTAPLIVDRVSNGGLWAGDSARIGGNGGSWRQAAITRGDLDVTDSVHTGSTFARASHAPVETLVVSTSSLPASIGGPGPILTIVPRTVDRWMGSLSAGGISNALQSRNNSGDGPPSIARYVMHRDAGGDVGGLLGERIRFFTGVQSSASNAVERNEPTILSSAVRSLFAEVTVTVGERNRLRISPSLDDSTRPYPGRARFRDRNARDHSRFGAVDSSWDHWSADGTAWSMSVGASHTDLDPPSGMRPLDPGVAERLRDGPVPSLFAVAPGTRRRWSGRVDVEPAIDSRHLVTVGASAERNTATEAPSATASVAELVNGLPARMWEYSYRGDRTRWLSMEMAAYASDQISLPFGILVDGGVRFDAVRGSARRARNSISWRSLAPRLNARWLIDDAAAWVVSAGFARYAHHLPLDYFAFGDPAVASGRAYLWTDPNRNQQFSEDERGALVAAVGPCCNGSVLNQVSPALQRPYTNELFAAVDARLKGWSVRIAAVDRRERRLIAAENIGVTAQDYRVRYIPDPGERFLESEDDRLLPVYDRDPSSFGNDRYLLTNPPGHGADYAGLEVTVERPLTRGWRTRFDGALYAGEAMGASRGFGPVENDSGGTGELFDNPNAGTFARGHQFFDRAYVMKWWSTYAGPKQWLVSAVARYQDGQPFSRVVIVPDLNQGAEAVQAYRRGRTRFTFTLTVDAHIEKGFSIGPARLSAIAELFNLLNTRNEVEEDIVTGPAFRATTAIQPPRAGRLGVRLEF